MNLSLTEKILELLKLPFSSFLTIEIFLIFVILYIFFLYNEKRQSKKVKLILTTLIIFFFSLLIFYFSKDFKVVISELIKYILKCFYFPNVIFYILTAVTSLVVLIINIFNNNKTKINKVITYTLTFIHLFLFTNFITIAIENKISLVDKTSIYEINNMFIIILFSQIIFIILILYKIINHFYTKKHHKLKKNN